MLCHLAQLYQGNFSQQSSVLPCRCVHLSEPSIHIWQSSWRFDQVDCYLVQSSPFPPASQGQTFPSHGHAMSKKLCPHLYAHTLVCSTNIIVEIAPYSDILFLNGWTYNSLPLILVLCFFRDLYFPLYKCQKAVLSFVIFHPSVLQNLQHGNKYSLTKLKTESAKLASLPSQLQSILIWHFLCIAWDFNTVNSIFSLLIILLFSMHLWQNILIFLSRASCKLLPSL